MIMFNYKIIINFCYGCDIIITSKTKRDRIEPFLIEINDKSKLIYTRILILITWMDDACSFFIFFRKNLVQFFKISATIVGQMYKTIYSQRLKTRIQQTKFYSFICGYIFSFW